MKESIFGVPDFRNLYAARFISTVGAKFFALAVSWWILDSGFERANTLLGVIMAATAIGTFGFAPFMGTFADKYNKKKTMMAALLGGAIVLGIIIAIFPVFNKIPLLFAVFAIFIYAFEPLFETSMQGSLNYIVKPELLPNAVSTVSGITSFSQALGAAFAGVAIAVLGVVGAFSLDCACYLVSILLVWRVTTKLPVNKPIPGEKASSYWTELAEGFRYIYKEKPLFYLLIFFGVINLWVSPIVLAIPIITKDVFDGTPLLMSGYEVAMAAGIIFITTLLGYVKKKFDRYRWSFYSLLLCGVSLTLFSFCTTIFPTFVFMVLFGLGMGMVNLSMMTIFQTYVPPYIQGRFFSIVNTIAGAVIPLSYAFVGVLSDYFGIMTLMTMNGILLLLTSFAMLFIPKIKGEYII
ncbi:DHA3 family macrolide efflux protein-like MFS transporter [Dysgonomonadaceae bacterium PH5-43]|nr:DHA3 family macrolide efflux protein-like MFS transporter [Dysgonomonadaceae bacterium PH5-43]